MSFIHRLPEEEGAASEPSAGDQESKAEFNRLDWFKNRNQMCVYVCVTVFVYVCVTLYQIED